MKSEASFLIIDDDADDRELLIEALKEVDESFRCFTASDGHMAIQMLKDDEVELPDYIFLDLRMPRYDGRRCLQEIKKVERCKQVPVIVYTTSSNVEDSKELRAMGASHFITKPRNTEEIYYVVSVLLEET